MKHFINQLSERPLNKREEEIVKYLFKRVIKYIQKTELDNNDKITCKLGHLYTIYFEGHLDRKFFDDVFIHVTK